MIIKKLTLKNFLIHKLKTVEFRDGITGILGPNGSGKSSLLEAILFCFYGAPGLRTKLENIRCTDADPKDTTEVSVCFDHKKDKYEMIRVIRSKSTDARVIKNGIEIAKTSTEVSQFIDNLFGNMNYKAFISSVFAKQDELASLSDSTPAVREKMIRTMLGIDELDIMIDKIRVDKRSLSDKISGVESTLSNEDGTPRKVTIEKDLEDFNERKEITNADVSQIEEDLCIIQKKIDKAEDEIKKLTTSKSEYTEAQIQKSAIEQSIVSFQNILDSNVNEQNTLLKSEKKLISLKQKENTYNTLQSQVNSLSTHSTNNQKRELLKLQKSTIGVQLTTLKEETEVLLNENTTYPVEKDLKTLNDALELPETEIQEINLTLVEIKHKIDISKSDLSKNTTQILKLKEQGPESVCPECERELGSQYINLLDKYELNEFEIDTALETLEEQYSKFSTKLSIRTIMVDDLKKEKENLLSQLKDRQHQHITIQKNEATIRSLSDNISTITSQIHDISKTIPQGLEFTNQDKLQTRLVRYQKDHEQFILLSNQVIKLPDVENIIAGIHKKIEVLGKDLTQITNKISILVKEGCTTEKYNAVKSNYRDLTEKLHKSEIDKIQLATDYKIMKNKITELTTKVEEIEEIEGSISTSRIELSVLDQLAGDRDSGLLINFRRFLISRIRPKLSIYASQLIGDMTDGKYSLIELDENYNILVLDKGELHNITRFSGGEAQLFNLCLRLSITKLIGERHGTDALSFIILDEIFGALDSDRKLMAMSTLRSLKNQFEQIILITHAQELKDGLDRVVEL